MVWNFSPEPARVTLQLDGLPKGHNAKRILLDSRTPNPDENSRLHALGPLPLPPPDGKPPVIDLEPYGVSFWMIER